MTEQVLGIQPIDIPVTTAKEHWKQAVEYARNVHNEYVLEMKRCYYYAKRGYKLINLYDVLRQAGKNSDGDPKLAITQANARECFFLKNERGHDYYYIEDTWRRWGYLKTDIPVPDNVFRPWQRDELTKTIVHERLSATPPTIPTEHLPDGQLKRYHILWEVPKWTQLPPRKDPILLKRLGKATYAILKTWDPTPLEQAIAEGRTFNH